MKKEFYLDPFREKGFPCEDCLQEELESEGGKQMVFGKNGSEYGYDLSSEKFRLAFDFLKRDDLSELAVGAIELGEGVVANIQHYETIEWESADFETHDRNFDIQYVIEGEESCPRYNRLLRNEWFFVLTPFLHRVAGIGLRT